MPLQNTIYLEPWERGASLNRVAAADFVPWGYLKSSFKK